MAAAAAAADVVVLRHYLQPLVVILRPREAAGYNLASAGWQVAEAAAAARAPVAPAPGKRYHLCVGNAVVEQHAAACYDDQQRQGLQGGGSSALERRVPGRLRERALTPLHLNADRSQTRLQLRQGAPRCVPAAERPSSCWRWESAV